MDKLIEGLIGMGVTPVNLVRTLGALLLLVGLLEPTTFLGIQIPWSTSKRIISAIAGMFIFLSTVPQLQFWNWDKVRVDVSLISSSEANVQKGIDAIMSARSGNSYPWCFDHASAGLTPLNETLAVLKKLRTTK
ncbi:hypothetical protein [Bradyrhizobium stylosanthis]|uniref:hypothetical protein n=1 Tax=Bradyrhizobium stylosanthis TaxID=1803665 RepID=UPI0011A60358|nr:hypothetical protein [Bradyrhizobium stylosanthis]